MITIERVSEVFGFTPGEWRVKDTGNKGYTVWGDVGKTGSMQIAETGYAGFDLINAQLMATSPQMLHALIESQIHDDKLFGGVDTDYIKIIESADRQKRKWPELREELTK